MRHETKRFVVASDFHLGSEYEDLAAVAKWRQFLDAYRPHIVVLAGDLVDTDSLDEWNRRLEGYPGIRIRGNHDPVGAGVTRVRMGPLYVEHGDLNRDRPTPTIQGHWHLGRGFTAGCMCRADRPDTPRAVQGFIAGAYRGSEWFLSHIKVTGVGPSENRQVQLSHRFGMFYGFIDHTVAVLEVNGFGKVWD